jgi:hypothetical protein
MKAAGIGAGLPGDVVFYYRGAVTPGLIDALSRAMDETPRGAAAPALRKVYQVCVECLQNVIRHGAPAPNASEPEICIRRAGKDFVMSAGNEMEASGEAGLRERLDAINAMDPAALKAAYLEQLEHGKLSGKGGAGLGLYTLARKSGRPLDYRFDPLPNDRTYFTVSFFL